MPDPPRPFSPSSPEGLRARVAELEAALERERQNRHHPLLDQLAEKRESLGVLAGGIAHSFNNLLTGVLGYAELASREIPAESPAQNFLDEVTRAARRGAELTAQLLLHAGKGRFEFERVSLSALVQEMGRQLLAIVPRQATLRFECAGACPVVAADSEQVRQMVLSLVANAGEALEDKPGSITVRTGVRQVDRPADCSPYADPNLPGGLYVWLEVADTGTGMSRATLARIFEPFFTTRFIGRGLGLAAVLGIVRGHHAFLNVGSAPGQGSTFEVFFPALPGDGETAASDSATLPADEPISS